MHRSELTARAVALVYNWWNWYVRAANPQARREALTSRPLLLAAVGRATHSGDSTELHLTPMHAEVGLMQTMIANVQATIAYVCWRRPKSAEKWRRKLVSTQFCLPWSQRGFVTRIDCCSLWAASRVRFAGLSPALDPTHRAYFVPAFSPPPDLRGNRQPLTPM